MRRWLYQLFIAAQILVFLLGLLWFWHTSPFSDPIIERSQSEVRQALDRAMARRVDQDWLDNRLSTALAEADIDRASLLIAIGADRTPAVLPSQQLRDEYDRQARVAGSYWAAAGACGHCAVDATSCKSATYLTTCLIPFELTPLGDLNALRAEAWAALSGQEIDELNAGLAILGLGATTLIVVSGPVSATAKVGATTLRIARKIGSLTTRMAGELSDMARLNMKAGGLLRWARGSGPLEDALDVGRLARLETVSESMTAVARRTSSAEALILVRHVDTAEDAARLARVAEAAGPDTRKFFTALGKSRVFRALVRLSDTALFGATLIYAAMIHVLTGIAHFAGDRILHGVRQLLRPR
ncbi:hypothetical protein [Puniceibacterium confluentis]|uniref:hypothetical protein n=1 Tax=Puniceibacterium confluentis TaxID=1958944 RepID=UPI0035612E6D